MKPTDKSPDLHENRLHCAGWMKTAVLVSARDRHKNKRMVDIKLLTLAAAMTDFKYSLRA
jgi:hypothetical protein